MTKRPRQAHKKRSDAGFSKRGGKKTGLGESRREETRAPKRQTSGGSKPGENLFLYGIHSVEAALGNPRRNLVRLLATENGLSRLEKHDADLSKVEIVLAEPGQLDRFVGRDAVHQGVVIECKPLDAIDGSELFLLAEHKLLLVLDQITDPHNVGAILRSASAFGVGAILTTHRNSAVESGVLAKAASGALEHLPMIDVRNLSKAIGTLNEMGFVTIGLDSAGPDVLEATIAGSNGKPVALVLGAEGKGLREKTRESCLHLARLDMPGAIKSLNVSNAAALSLYIASRGHTA